MKRMVSSWERSVVQPNRKVSSWVRCTGWMGRTRPFKDFNLFNRCTGEPMTQVEKELFVFEVLQRSKWYFVLKITSLKNNMRQPYSTDNRLKRVFPWSMCTYVVYAPSLWRLVSHSCERDLEVDCSFSETENFQNAKNTSDYISTLRNMLIYSEVWRTIAPHRNCSAWNFCFLFFIVQW